MSNREHISLMSCSFELYLNEIAHWLVPDIISQRTLSRMREVLQVLPGKTTNAVGLEFHTVKSDYDCDLSLSIDPYVDKNELIAWRYDEFDKDYTEFELIHDIKIIRDIVKVWDDPQTRLSEILREIALEMDTRISSEGIPLNIFCTLLENIHPVRISETIATCLVDKLDGTAQGNLPGCLKQIAGLPNDLFITHLGFMLGRPVRALRVLIRCKTAELWNVVKTLGLHPETYLNFNDFIALVQPRCSHVTIASNIFEHGIGTDFAIECGFLGTATSDEEEWWPDFIAAIGTFGKWDIPVAAMSLVDTLKKKRNALAQASNNSGNPIMWGLNHIKISFSTEMHPVMKWYIAMHGAKKNNCNKL